MTTSAKDRFHAGRNIAMKVPPHQFDETVAFYRDVVGLDQLHAVENSVAFAFGFMKLWIDRTDEVDQAQIWLEIQSDDTGKAADMLKAAGVERCDEVEPLPYDFDGFWIRNPAGIVHLVSHPAADSEGVA